MKLNKMINFIARLFLTVSSISFFVVVYMVKTKYDFLDPFVSKEISYLLYPAFCVFILTPLALWICNRMPNESIGSIEFIEPANNEFLPNYLAFFFVALALPYTDKTLLTNPFTEPAFLLVFFITMGLIFASRVSYFNPIFLILGYNFYYVTTSNKVKIMLISRRNLKMPKDFKSQNLKRINDYAFIEVKSK